MSTYHFAIVVIIEAFQKLHATTFAATRAANQRHRLSTVNRKVDALENFVLWSTWIVEFHSLEGDITRTAVWLLADDRTDENLWHSIDEFKNTGRGHFAFLVIR